MSKYIIELDDRIKLVTSVGVTENGIVYTTSDYVHNLEELNSDYINEHYGELQDEAYQRGHDDGYEAGCATAFKPVSDAEYQRGLDEAVNAFKKLYSCGWERDWKAMGFEFDEGEWSTSFEFIIGHYTASEIVEKVKAYEDKELHVGDEVFAPRTRTAYLVTNLDGLVAGISKSGKVHLQPEEELVKTNKHFGSIDEYMKGENNA